MSIPLSLREKRRYLVIRPVHGTEKELLKHLRRYLGILEFAKAGIKIVRREKDCIILRCTRESLWEVRGIIALSKGRYDVLGVSGTIKKAREKFLSGR